jgi:hypothetical protein
MISTGFCFASACWCDSSHVNATDRTSDVSKPVRVRRELQLATLDDSVGSGHLCVSEYCSMAQHHPYPNIIPWLHRGCRWLGHVLCASMKRACVAVCASQGTPIGQPRRRNHNSSQVRLQQEAGSRKQESLPYDRRNQYSKHQRATFATIGRSWDQVQVSQARRICWYVTYKSLREVISQPLKLSLAVI